MKITICGSLAFVKEMIEAKEILQNNNHEVLLPVELNNINYQNKDKKQGAKNIIEQDLIRKHYNKIIFSDAILIINYEKKGVKGYIGGNTFLEMGFAHVNNKTLFVLNPLPENSPYFEEMSGMQPVILNEDLSKIPDE